ncbi:MAG: FtsK/SpoIIIE domain-containing protein [Cryobacterium sp.]
MTTIPGQTTPQPLPPIRLPQKPTPPSRPGFPVIACAAPLLAAGLIWWITGSALVLVFAVLSPVIAVAGLLDGRRSSSRQRRRDAADYAAAMTEATDRVDHRLARLHRDAWSAAPTAHRILTVPDDPGRWADPTTITVVLGSGPSPSGLRLDGGGDSAEHRELHERAAVLPLAPIGVDPADGIGIVGPGVIGRSLARSLVVQLVGQLSPRALRVRVPPGPAWAWAAELPHHNARAARCLTVEEAGPVVSPAVRPTPSAAGEMRITLAERVTGLPPGCGTVIRAQGVSEADVVRLAGQPCELSIAPILVAERQVSDLGEILTREAETAGLGGGDTALPEVIAFAPLCTARPESTDDSIAESPAAGSLSCVIGLAEQGELHVDLVAEGPHALVGGTTGSGKSELLVTWVAALAARYPPSQVTFLLVDFKGGAAFDAVRELPHCVGLITDLDEREAARALASLGAELRHRERVLRETGGRDITDPHSAGRLARLVIVVDEFATMLEALPALHALFVDIAARGRSLGVHLVLCTQRPAGVVRDSLLANCSLRISLRVNNRADSQAVIGSDAAALIPGDLPGRCLVRRGSEAAVAGQVATSTTADIRQILLIRPAPSSTPRRPWLDPLPPQVTAEMVAAVAGVDAADPDDSEFLLGLLDQPDHQRYRVARYDPQSAGNLLVVGGARTGKSTLLAALAVQAPRRVWLVPADVEASWDALVRARAELDGLAVPPTGPARRHDVDQGRRLLLLDDIDAVLARWGDEHRAAAVDLLTGILRDNGAAGQKLVVTAQRLTGSLQALPALCQSRLVLGLPTVHEHQAAGEPAAGYDSALPPGGGRWRGERIQLLHAESAGATRRPLAAPSLLADEAAPMLLVVAGSAARSAAAFRAAQLAAYPQVLELGAHPGSGASGGRVEASEVAAGTVLVADADTWQAHWSMLTALRSVAPLVFDGATLSDYRLITRRRDLPPPVAPGRSHGWLVTPDGFVRRAKVP